MRQMKKKITLTISYLFETDEDDRDDYKTFKEIRDVDYDNIDRPLIRLEDVGWKIKRAIVKDA